MNDPLSKDLVSICNVGEAGCDIAIAPSVNGVGLVHLEPGERWAWQHSRSLNEKEPLTSKPVVIDAQGLIRENDRLRAALEGMLRYYCPYVDESPPRYIATNAAAIAAVEALGPAQEVTSLCCDCPTVKCARCGKVEGPMCAMRAEEGNEWECPDCNDRCDAAEKAAQETACTHPLGLVNGYCARCHRTITTEET